MSGVDNGGFVHHDDKDKHHQLENLSSPPSPGLHRRKNSTKRDTFQPVTISLSDEKSKDDENEGFEEEFQPHQGNVISRTIDGIWKSIGRFTKKYKTLMKILFLVALNAGIIIYMTFASLYWTNTGNCVWEWCDGFGMLIILLTIIYGTMIYFLVLKRYLGKFVHDRCWIHVEKFGSRVFRRWFLLRLFIYLLPLAALITFLVIDTVGSRERLVSFGGMIVLILLGFLFSKYPGQINWRPVFWGLGLQFTFGLLTIRWQVGREIFRCIGDKSALFLSYADAGSSFVYGQDMIFNNMVFAFQVLSVIYFFSFMISILSYYGAIQWIVLKLGWLLQISLGTTVCESVNAAASIFLSMTESSLLIKPYIKELTRSELHSVMTAGFATVAGSVLAAYISFGVSPAHLVTASVMSAPAALCYSKLFYPETERSKTKVSNIVTEKSTDTSVLDAATNGAFAAIYLVLGILASIIAFVSFVAFVNALLSWSMGLVGHPEVDFQFLLGKIFIPLSYVLGVSIEDCEEVGMLIGLKTVINEFVAYERLGKLTKDCLISPRSEAIATYALCGFANPGSIGIMVGALATMAPSQRPNITSVAFRAFLAGSATCFMTASIAGMLLTDESYLDYNTLDRNCTYNATATYFYVPI